MMTSEYNEKSKVRLEVHRALRQKMIEGGVWNLDEINWYHTSCFDAEVCNGGVSAYFTQGAFDNIQFVQDFTKSLGLEEIHILISNFLSMVPSGLRFGSDEMVEWIFSETVKVEVAAVDKCYYEARKKLICKMADLAIRKSFPRMSQV